MWRYLVGALAALLLAGGGLLWWRTTAVAERSALLQRTTPVGADVTEDGEALPEPPAASEKTREQKRFGRYDKDRDGKITRDEYLAQRRKAFAKLDTDGDGRLSFDEWAIKAATKFATADADRTGILTPAEFATTRVVRKKRPAVNCPPSAAPAREDEES